MNKISLDKKDEIKNTIFIVFLLLPIFQPAALNLEKFSIIDNFYTVGKILSSIFITTMYIKYLIKEKTINSIILIIFIINLYIFINTLIQFKLYKALIMKVSSVLVFCLIIDYYSNKKTKELIHALLIIFELLIYTNFIFMIINQVGFISPYSHFLGNRCLLLAFFIIGITLSLLWKSYSGNNIRFYIFLTICFISNLIGKSATGLLGFCLFFIFYFTGFYKSKYFSLTGGIIFYILAFLSIVIFRIQNHFGSFFSMLGKNVTFSGRTILWDRSLEYIKSRPIFGYGFLDGENRMPLIGYGHCHNFVMEQLFEGGIIQLALFLFFLVIIIKRLKDANNSIQSKYIVLGLFILLFHLLVESGLHYYYFLPFFLAFYISKISDAMPIKEKTKINEN